MLFLILILPGCSTEPEEEIVTVVEDYEEPGVLELPEVEEEPEPKDIPEPESPDDQVDVDISSDPVEDTDNVQPSHPVIVDGDYLLALVSKDTLLKSDYIPSDLQPVPSHMKPSYSMQLRAAALHNLELLWNAAAYDGVELHIRSAYRSYSTQAGLFADYASRHGEEEANRFSARPGQSEHQLGTTVDFGGTAVDFSAAFAETPQGKWLADNAWYFGFAMSYPAGKENVTGYIFEPWHFRFIGIEEAAEWKVSGMALIEYLESKPQFFE
jgi:D-alanyl-D-alanine carboxypeptidase